MYKEFYIFVHLDILTIMLKKKKKNQSDLNEKHISEKF